MLDKYSILNYFSTILIFALNIIYKTLIYANLSPFQNYCHLVQCCFQRYRLPLLLFQNCLHHHHNLLECRKQYIHQNHSSMCYNLLSSYYQEDSSRKLGMKLETRFPKLKIITCNISKSMK